MRALFFFGGGGGGLSDSRTIHHSVEVGGGVLGTRPRPYLRSGDGVQTFLRLPPPLFKLA